MRFYLFDVNIQIKEVFLYRVVRGVILERDDAVTNNETVNIRDYDDFYIKFHDEFSLLNWLVSGMSLKDALLNNVPDVKVTNKVDAKEFGLNMNDLSDYMEVLASK